jgi:hypothetical protein
MHTRFAANQSVEILVPPQPIPVHDYLHQADRIVNTLTSHGQIESLSHNTYRLQLRSLNFLSVKLQPIVDIQVWTTSDDTLHLQSVGCELLGLEAFRQKRFTLNLVGHLYPTVARQTTHLHGQVDLTVDVHVPMPIALTPKPILETTGNTIMGGVLLTMKQRLMKNLVADYQNWVRSEQFLLGAHAPEPV